MRERESFCRVFGVAVATAAAATAGRFERSPVGSRRLLFAIRHGQRIGDNQIVLLEARHRRKLHPVEDAQGPGDLEKNHKQERKKANAALSREREEREESSISSPRCGAQRLGALDLPVERRFMLASIVPSARLAVEGRGAGEAVVTFTRHDDSEINVRGVTTVLRGPDGLFRRMAIFADFSALYPAAA